MSWIRSKTTASAIDNRSRLETSLEYGTSPPEPARDLLHIIRAESCHAVVNICRAVREEWDAIDEETWRSL